MKYLITVTQEDILKGCPRSCFTCPLAWAVERNFPPFTFSAVSETFITPRDGSRDIKLPRSAQRFIRRFDRRLPVKPFRFYIEVPNDS